MLKAKNFLSQSDTRNYTSICHLPKFVPLKNVCILPSIQVVLLIIPIFCVRINFTVVQTKKPTRCRNATVSPRFDASESQPTIRGAFSAFLASKRFPPTVCWAPFRFSLFPNAENRGDLQSPQKNPKPKDFVFLMQFAFRGEQKSCL